MKHSHIAVLGASSLALVTTALSPIPTASAAPDDAARTTHDGRLVAAQFSPRYIVSMLPDGTNRQRIANFAQDVGIGPIDVTEDGSQVAMTIAKRNGHIYTVNADGSDFQQVNGNGIAPTFSPSGSRIAFTRVDDDTHSLMRMRADGSGLTNLTTGAEPRPWFFQSWSPDGDYVAFITQNRAETKQTLVLTNPQGTWFRYVKAFQLKRGAVYGLNWSPDSSEIIYTRYSRNEKNADLWTITKNGSTIQRITDTPDRKELSPAYSADGTQIACVLQFRDIVVMDADGSNRNRVQTDAEEVQVAWGGTP